MNATVAPIASAGSGSPATEMSWFAGAKSAVCLTHPEKTWVTFSLPLTISWSNPESPATTQASQSWAPSSVVVCDQVGS